MEKYNLLYQKYRTQMSTVIPNDLLSKTEFEARFVPELVKMNIIESDASCAGEGFLYYALWTDEVTHCYVPAYGYFAESEKTMVRLFQRLAETVVTDGTNDFSVNIYSGDTACLTAFHMMQFGNMSEVCIKKLEDKYSEADEFHIKVLNKKEITQNWSEIWKATECIVNHLKESPVFYPAEEFTEDVYREFFMSDEVELIAAYKDDNIAGIIEWNKEGNDFLPEKNNSVNVGEVYVYPEYRGTGLAERLLRFSEKRAIEEGYQYMWVEHGTANPNARGFWNKYFNTYRYELVRNIKSLI